MKPRAAAALLLLVLCTVPPAALAQRLMAFYERALASNPTLRTSELGVEQAQAQSDLAESRLLPQVSATGSYSWNDTHDSGSASRHYNGVRSGIQAQQPLLDMASYYKVQGARFGVTQSEQALRSQRLTLAGDIVDRYLTVLQAADEVATLESEKEAVDSQLKRLRFMREREMVKVTDLYEVEAYFQGLLTRGIESRHAQAVALARLRELSDLDAVNLPPLARETFAPIPGDEDRWVNDATLSNPSLAALWHATEVALMDIRSGNAEYSPGVVLTVSKTHSDQGYDNRLVPAYTIGSISVQVTIPLYQGGRVQATVKDASARYRIALEKYEGARREVERDTRTAYLNAATHHARIGSTSDEVDALAKVVQAQQKSYERGVSTIIDVLTAQRRYFKARADLLKARYDFIRGYTALRVRAGSLTDQDLQEIDGWTVADRASSP